MKKVLIPFILSLFVFMSVASATMVYLDPQNVGGSVGDTFDVDIKVKDVENLYAYELKLGYDTNLLDADDILSSNFLNEPTEEIKRMIDEENGFLWYAKTSVNPAEPKSGSGTLATVTFRVTGRGKCDLSLYETIFTNSDIEAIEPSVKGSVFNSSGVAFSNQILSLFVVLILVIIVVFLFVRKKPKKKSRK